MDPKNKRIMELAQKVLDKEHPHLDLSPLRISYSRYVGCNMCPCSPGYVIRAKHPVNKLTNTFVDTE